MNTTTTASASLSLSRRAHAALEVALIFLLLFVFASSPTPGDDEAHYLGKAKHYWNPEWLAGDFFLETPDVHVVFNWTLGWLTLFLSLATTAWIGRIAAWLLLAFAWQRLSWAIVPRRLVSLLTMAWFLVLQQYGTAAREWIVGGVEAKCFAWALVVLAVEQLVRTAGGFRVQGSGFRESEKSQESWRWNWVWLLLGLAAAFHVLVGGWAVVAAMFTWISTKQRPSLASMLPALALGGLISLLGVVPALRLSDGAAPEVVREAQRIYVFQRLNHHLVIHDFPRQYLLQFSLVLVAWLAVCWWSRKTTHSWPLRKFILGSLVFALVGLVIDQATLLQPDLAAALLRFYWFRLADMLVPIGLALGLAELWASLSRDRIAMSSAPHALAARSRLNDVLLVVLCLVPMTVLGWRAATRTADRRSGAEVQANIPREDIAAWREACAWIDRQTPASSRFLLPTPYQCFRWHAERSEVANWKDIPQNAVDIIEWRDRNRAVRSWWASLQRHGFTPAVERQLHRLADEYDVQYVVVPHLLYAQPLPLTPVHSTTAAAAHGYTVYWIGPHRAS